MTQSAVEGEEMGIQRSRKISYGVFAFVLLCSLAAFAQTSPQVKKTQNAVITAQTMEYDWEQHIAEFSGNTKLVLSGAYEATIWAPRMSVRLNAKADRVLSVEAAGPVRFLLITRPDANGQRRKIVATAKEKAIYSDETQLITLLGGATTDLLPLEAATSEKEGLERLEAVHFVGEKITVNLKTNRLTVDNANLTVETRTE